MSASDWIMGAALMAGGVFIGVYGELLFRFVLAVMGFGVGFVAIFSLLESQSDPMRILFSVIAGGIVAAVFFMLFNFGLYIAGGVLGSVLGLTIAGIIGQTDNGLGPVALILALAGAGGAGFFGPRLGAMIIPLATAAASAFMIVYGYATWFQSTYNLSDNTGEHLARTSLIVLMIVVYGMSFLAQWNIASLRRRLIR